MKYQMRNKNYLSEEITWNSTGNPVYPYRAVHAGKELLIRLNDFPAQQLYTLLVDDKEIADFDDWATGWNRPPKTVEMKKARSAAAKSPSRGASARAFGKAKSLGYSARKG